LFCFKVLVWHPLAKAEEKLRTAVRMAYAPGVIRLDKLRVVANGPRATILLGDSLCPHIYSPT